MRAIVLLLLGGGLIWSVLKFFPRTMEEGGSQIEQAETAEVEQPHVRGPDPRPPALAPSAKREAAFEPRQVQTPPTGEPSEEQGFEIPVGRADLVEIGALVAHSGVQSVGDWLDISAGLLGADRERAVRAFSLAVAGDRSKAREIAKRISSPRSLPGRIRWALQRILSGEFTEAWPANIKGGDALELGMLLRLGVIEARALVEQRQEPIAARRLTEVFLAELNAPWPADFKALNAWRSLLEKIQVRHRWNPEGDWSFESVVVKRGDSLAAIRKRYITKYPDRLICTGLMAKANGIERDLIHPDTVLRIPTEPVTLLVDLDAHWLLYFQGTEVVAAYPVGIGADGEETIVGRFTIGEKLEEPTWFRRNLPPIVFGEEGNPLGTRYMTWFKEGVKTHFGFHGTWEPETIGQNKSQGCIRMRNGDAEELFSLTPLGSKFDVQP